MGHGIMAWNSQDSSIASRDVRLVRAQVNRVQSLQHLLEVRSWEPISKLHAWSSGEVGEQAHLHCPKCLDEWHDARGASLKFKLVVVPCGGVTTLPGSSHWSSVRAGAPHAILTKVCLCNTFCSPVKERLTLETVFGTGFVTSCLVIKLIPTMTSLLCVPPQPRLHTTNSALLQGLDLVFLRLLD
eukprot:jgi/Bigna1/127844/aug1.5_g2552